MEDGDTILEIKFTEGVDGVNKKVFTLHPEYVGLDRKDKINMLNKLSKWIQDQRDELK